MIVYDKYVDSPEAMLPFEAQKRLIGQLQGWGVTIFDVGANRGQTALAYRLVFPDAEIYCFEPFPPVFSELKHDLAGDKKVHLVPKAVSDTSGRTVFHVNRVDHASSLLPHLESARLLYAQQTERQSTISVQAITLDKYVSDNNISTVDILKIDVQGGELKVLRGATDLLWGDDIHIIFTEVWGTPHYEGSPLLHDVCSFLSGYGYSLFDLFNIKRAAVNGQLEWCDAIFVSETLRHIIDNPEPKKR